MAEDSLSTLDDALAKFQREHDLIPLEIEDGEFTYILRQAQERMWDVRKLDGSDLAAHYKVRQVGEKWICDCQAAWKGRQCKHRTWVETLMSPRLRKYLTKRSK